jgi:Flp pilus assembly protein TadD
MPKIIAADRNLNSALAYLENGKSGAAREICEYLLKANTPDPRVLHCLGLAYLQEKNLQRAIERLNEALQLAPEQPEYQMDLAVVHHQNGNLAEALRGHKKVLRLVPDNPAALNNYAITLWDLGQIEEAINVYRRVLKKESLYPDANFNLGLALFSESDPVPAMTCFARAVLANPWYLEAVFFYGVMLELKGDDDEAKRQFKKLETGEVAYLADSWAYVKTKRSGKTKLLTNTFRTLSFALEQATVSGLIMEFGVRFGPSINHLAACTDELIHGFDSFEGLPEPWGQHPKGTYSLDGQLPKIGENVRLYCGLFENTLPEFLAAHRQPIRFANIDCDLFTSTATVLENIHGQIVSGTILVFDEYLCAPKWREDEFRAFREAVKRYGWKYDYLAFNLPTRQAVIRIECA